MKTTISIVILILFHFGLSAQDDHRPLMKGDDAYKSGNYNKAEEEYMRAIDANPNSQKGHFNRGNAIYKGTDPAGTPEDVKERMDKAAAAYLSAIENIEDPVDRANAYHNLGNAYVNKQDMAKGVEAYKNALRLNPKDMDTKANLQYALRQMQQQQQQQQQESGEGEKSDSDEQQEPQDSQDNSEQQDNQDQQQDEQQDQEPSDEEKEGSQSQEGKQEDQPSPEEMSKEEVLRQLKVMDEEEKKVQEKLKKEQQSEYKSNKDW